MKKIDKTYYDVYQYLSNHGEYTALSIEGKLQLIEEIHRDIVFDLQEK
jgi:hypothetical protein